MKSLSNQYKEIYKDQIINSSLAENISDFESEHYKVKNENTELKEDMEQIKFELDQLKKDDSNALVDISKKLSEALKSGGEDELLKQFALNRAKIMDHFTMAYIAELNLKPSQVQLVQGVNDDGEVVMYFEKHSTLILPNNLK